MAVMVTLAKFQGHQLLTFTLAHSLGYLVVVTVTLPSSLSYDGHTGQVYQVHLLVMVGWWNCAGVTVLTEECSSES